MHYIYIYTYTLHYIGRTIIQNSVIEVNKWFRSYAQHNTYMTKESLTNSEASKCKPSDCF